MISDDHQDGQACSDGSATCILEEILVDILNLLSKVSEILHLTWLRPIVFLIELVFVELCNDAT